MKLTSIFHLKCIISFQVNLGLWQLTNSTEHIYLHSSKPLRIHVPIVKGRLCCENIYIGEFYALLYFPSQ